MKTRSRQLLRRLCAVVGIAGNSSTKQFDTNIFYTIASSICSTLVLAKYNRIGRVTTWRGLLSRFMETVELHGQKLVVPAKAPYGMPSARHRDDSDWCIEARSHAWQRGGSARTAHHRQQTV